MVDDSRLRVGIKHKNKVYPIFESGLWFQEGFLSLFFPAFELWYKINDYQMMNQVKKIDVNNSDAWTVLVFYEEKAESFIVVREEQYATGEEAHTRAQYLAEQIGAGGYKFIKPAKGMLNQDTHRPQ